MAGILIIRGKIIIKDMIITKQNTSPLNDINKGRDRNKTMSRVSDSM